MKKWLDYLLEREEKHEYSCLMAMLPVNLSSKIVKWQKGFIDKKDLYTGEPNMGMETEPHITVLYGFHDDAPDKVKKLLDIKPIHVKLGLTSMFESSNYDVVKFSIESEDLKSLNRLMRKNCKYTSKYPKYVPHCTIAYVKKGTGKNYINDDEFKSNTATINKLIFSSSNGKRTASELPLPQGERLPS
jgi:2'-5' RNA ligase